MLHNKIFLGEELVFEQETKVALPTLHKDDVVDIFDKEFIVTRRRFAFNEDAFITIYDLKG
jgi:hypothetical protein